MWQMISGLANASGATKPLKLHAWVVPLVVLAANNNAGDSAMSTRVPGKAGSNSYRERNAHIGIEVLGVKIERAER